MPSAPPLKWDELGALVEGLAYAQRPIMAAVQGITRQLGLGRRGAFILNLVSEGTNYPNEIATKLNTSRSLVTADLNRLMAAGLLISVSTAADKRKTQLQLTDAGSKVCTDVRNEMARLVRRNLAAYSAADLLLFTEMLHAVRWLEPEDRHGP